MSDTTRLTFLERLQAKDARAWSDLDALCRTGVCAAVKRWLGRQCPHIDAEDVAQECYLAVLNELPAFERQRKGSFRAWLNRIARNKTLEVLRRRPPVAWSPERLQEFVGKLSDPHLDVEIVEAVELRACLLRVVRDRASIPFDQVALLLDGQATVDEIAEKLACTREAVYARRTRIRAELREAMTEFEGLLE